MQSYLVLALLWIAWCTIHSATISLRFTDWLHRRWPVARRFHRLAYNAVALVSLAAVVVATRPIHGPSLLQWRGPLLAVRALLLGGALFFFIAGGRNYDWRQFIGWQQIRTAASHAALGSDGALRTGGILSVTRHPWYLGSLLLIWARDLDTAGLIVNVILSAYLVVGTLLEEQKLVAIHGEAYRTYQQQVSMLFPIRYLGTRFGNRA